MRIDTNRTCLAGLAGLMLLILAFAAGCGKSQPAPPATSPAASPPAAASAADTPPPPPPTVPAKPPETVQKKAEAGVGEKGHGYGAGPIATPIAAYFQVRERVAFDIQIPHSMNLFKASEGRPPKSNDEFMEKIIKANMIHLPKLPEGQYYQYDPKQEQLMVIEPAR